MSRTLAVLIAVLTWSGNSIFAETTARDNAVERGLKFLAEHQQKSGAWQLGGYGDCTGVTSLTVMAFLSAGHVPGEGPYGSRLQKAIDWVLDHAKPVDKTKGRETVLLVSHRTFGPMYAHGISTVMLAEAVRKLDRKRADRCREVLERAIRLILQAHDIDKPEQHAGGWRYLPTAKDSDLTVSGWQILAMKAAQSAGFAVSRKHFDRAIAYVRRCQSKRDGGFTYQPHPTGSRTAGRTAVGVLCLELTTQHKSPEAIAGGHFLMTHSLRVRDQWYFYETYYFTAAAYRLGGTYRATAIGGLSSLMSNQSLDGSWRGSSSERRLGTAYTTALSLLALTVDSSQLSIYRR